MYGRDIIQTLKSVQNNPIRSDHKQYETPGPLTTRRRNSSIFSKNLLFLLLSVRSQSWSGNRRVVVSTFTPFTKVILSDVKEVRRLLGSKEKGDSN